MDQANAGVPEAWVTAADASEAEAHRLWMTLKTLLDHPDFPKDQYEDVHKILWPQSSQWDFGEDSSAPDSATEASGELSEPILDQLRAGRDAAIRGEHGVRLDTLTREERRKVRSGDTQPPFPIEPIKGPIMWDQWFKDIIAEGEDEGEDEEEDAYPPETILEGFEPYPHPWRADAGDVSLTLKDDLPIFDMNTEEGRASFKARFDLYMGSGDHPNIDAQPPTLPDSGDDQ